MEIDQSLPPGYEEKFFQLKNRKKRKKMIEDELKLEELKLEELPPGYREKFSYLTHKLFFNINEVIVKYMEYFNEEEKEFALPHTIDTIAINALSRMISLIILEISKKDSIEKQEIIKYFQKLAHEALDGNIKVIMEIRGEKD